MLVAKSNRLGLSADDFTKMEPFGLQLLSRKGNEPGQRAVRGTASAPINSAITQLLGRIN